MSERRYSPLATLFAATFLFRIGNAVAALALPWFVLSHTKSAAWAGATAASSVIATIIGAWVGGGLVDRFGRAPVALISGVVGGVAMASIPLLDAVGALSNTGLIACVVLGAAFDAPGMAAQDSELPKLGHVAGLSVERVSSLKAVIGNVAILGGPALGGAAIGLLGAAPTLGLTAFCSVLAGLLGAWVLPARAARTMTTTATLSMRAGVAFLWSEPLLRPLFGIVMIFVGIVGANGSVIMPALFVDAGRQVAELGLFSSMMGAGGLLGIAIHASVGARISAQNWLAVAFWALLQRLAAVRGRLSLCADQAAAAKWWLSMPMASVSAEGPMPKALSTRRTSPLMPGCRHQGRACPLRRARMTSNPLIVA